MADPFEIQLAIAISDRRNMYEKYDCWPLIFGHRGACGYLVENTMPSFRKAIEMGADGIESDIFVTRDGVPFMCHEVFVKLRDEPKKVRAWTLYARDLKRIVLKNDERVPTLYEVFEEFAHKKNKYGKIIPISLDIEHYKAGSAAIKVARQYDCEDQLYFCGQRGLYLRSCRRTSPRVHLVASNVINRMTKHTILQSISRIHLWRVEAFNIKAGSFKPEYKYIIEEAGFKFFIWDLHTEKKLRTYIPYGPFALYSNFPDLAVKVRSELCNPPSKD